MSFISYAQNLEDVMLWRALKHIENGFYVDVGAAWPNDDSVTKAFYDKGWNGINIEPNEEFYNLLEKERARDINLRIAISTEIGQVPMYFFAGTGLSSLDQEVANSQIARGFSSVTSNVRTQKLFDTLSEYVNDRDIHFMKIDVEGWEQKVISSNDWTVFRPWIVLVESTRPSTQIDSFSEWEHLLLDNNYLFAYTDGLNRFYIASEHKELLAFFNYPPNIYDGFRVIGWVRDGAKLAEAEGHAADAESRAAVAESRAAVAESRAAVAESRAAVAESRAAVAEKRMNEILRSTSWRVTAPLRFLGHSLGRICQFPREFGKVILYSGIHYSTIPLRCVAKYLRQKPRLESKVYQLIAKHPYLLQYLKERVKGQQVRRQGIFKDWKHKDVSYDQLSPQTQRLYMDLNSAMARKKIKRKVKNENCH